MSSTAQRAETRIYSQQFDQITAHYDRDVAIAAKYGWAAPASRISGHGGEPRRDKNFQKQLGPVAEVGGGNPFFYGPIAPAVVVTCIAALIRLARAQREMNKPSGDFWGSSSQPTQTTATLATRADRVERIWPRPTFPFVSRN
jgi:hypothetical protein